MYVVPCTEKNELSQLLDSQIETKRRKLVQLNFRRKKQSIRRTIEISLALEKPPL